MAARDLAISNMLRRVHGENIESIKRSQAKAITTILKGTKILSLVDVITDSIYLKEVYDASIKPEN